MLTGHMACSSNTADKVASIFNLLLHDVAGMPELRFVVRVFRARSFQPYPRPEHHARHYSSYEESNGSVFRLSEKIDCTVRSLHRETLMLRSTCRCPTSALRFSGSGLQERNQGQAFRIPNHSKHCRERDKFKLVVRPWTTEAE